MGSISHIYPKPVAMKRFQEILSARHVFGLQQRKHNAQPAKHTPTHQPYDIGKVFNKNLIADVCLNKCLRIGTTGKYLARTTWEATVADIIT